MSKKKKMYYSGQDVFHSEKNSDINNKQDLGFIIPVHIPRMTWKGGRKRAAILGVGAGRKEKKKKSLDIFTYITC